MSVVARSVERATEYSAEDADVTLQLNRVLYPAIQADEKLTFIYRQIERTFERALADTKH